MIHVRVAEQPPVNVVTLNPDPVGIGVNSPVVVHNTNNYEDLRNLPQINSVVLLGNKSNDDIGIGSLSNTDIENILNIFI